MTLKIATVPPSKKPQSTGKYTQKSQCNTKQLMPLQRYRRGALMMMTTTRITIVNIIITTTTANIDEVLGLCRSLTAFFLY